MPTRSNSAHVHIAADDVSTDDRRQLEAFINETDQGSPVALLLQRILSSVARGSDIEMFADDAELSPKQAADLLKMSRPHLLKFMDRGDLPYHRVGSHRRITMSDLIQFADEREAGAQIVADALGNNGGTVSEHVELTAEELDELNKL